ncbi:MAG TPA: carbohydrate ABC transporter permease [Clostridiales bacterium]|nr:carbohydrate ABC transporter permease [Clostridiales bacterium]
MKIKRRYTTFPGMVFDIFNYAFFLAITLSFLLPFIHIAMYSISDITNYSRSGLFLYPRGLDFYIYRAALFNSSRVLQAFGVSVYVTFFGTIIGVLLSSMLAYGISKPLKGQNFLVFIIFFTMLFNGGMVPTWLLIRSLNLLDSVWALILPGVMSAFNVFLLRNFMKMLPEGIEESVMMDGGSYVVIFFRIVLPLSKPAIATVALMTLVGYWNDYFSSILYIYDKTKWSLATLIRDMLSRMDLTIMEGGQVVGLDVNRIDSVKMRSATILIAVIPVIMIYPFFQKYFEKGIMIGAIKG